MITRQILLLELRKTIHEVASIKSELESFDRKISEIQEAKHARNNALIYSSGARDRLKQLLFGPDANLTELWASNEEGLRVNLESPTV